MKFLEVDKYQYHTINLRMTIVMSIRPVVMITPLMMLIYLHSIELFKYFFYVVLILFNYLGTLFNTSEIFRYFV